MRRNHSITLSASCQRELWKHNILSRVWVRATVELFVEGLRNITTAHTTCIVLPLFSLLLGAPEVAEATEALMTLTAGALGPLAAGTEEAPAAPAAGAAEALAAEVLEAPTAGAGGR